ncbi:MAG TPA: GNAT family N-acetyltransferase [Phenylobacterium sp.]|jgi:ribosomal protein S18 acetylase RimI-like enzyme
MSAGPDIAIEACAPDDLDAVAALVNAAYRGEGGWTNEVGVVDGPRTSSEALKADLAQPQTAIFVLREAGEVAGCVRVDIEGEVAVIGMVAVRPGRQDQGLGRRLLDRAEAHARAEGARTARMTVVSVRPLLIAWYERRGYGLTGERTPFHGDGRFGRPRQPLELSVLEKQL